jgi:hypothetical protein
MDAKQRAMEQFEVAMAEAVKVAQEHLDRGVHPDGVAFYLAGITAGLPAEAQMAQIEAMASKMSAEERKRLLTALDEMDAADHEAPPSDPPTSG